MLNSERTHKIKGNKGEAGGAWESGEGGADEVWGEPRLPPSASLGERGASGWALGEPCSVEGSVCYTAVCVWPCMFYPVVFL